MEASKYGHTEVAELLLDHGARVDVQDSNRYSALVHASSKGHTEVAKLLLDHGAQVDMSALIYDLREGHNEVAKLLDHSARVGMQHSDG